jgi:uncharacterized SAM-binding protein YcdF (DUF218 family)
VCFVVFAGATAFLFAFPPVDTPQRADAVVVLAGDRGRLAKGLQLVRGGVAPVLVISDGAVPGWPEANRLCARRSRFRTICFHPDPYSTRGEAQFVARLARKRGWKRVVVVTSTYHVIRARRDFRRCFGGDVAGVAARPAPGNWIEGTALEWPKLLYSLTVGRRC